MIDKKFRDALMGKLILTEVIEASSYKDMKLAGHSDNVRLIDMVNDDGWSASWMYSADCMASSCFMKARIFGSQYVACSQSLGGISVQNGKQDDPALNDYIQDMTHDGSMSFIIAQLIIKHAVYKSLQETPDGLVVANPPVVSKMLSTTNEGHLLPLPKHENMMKEHFLSMLPDSNEIRLSHTLDQTASLQE